MKNVRRCVFGALRVTAFVSLRNNSLTFLSFSGCLCLPLLLWFILSPFSFSLPPSLLSLSLSVKMQCASEQTAPVLSTHKSSSGVSKLDGSFVSFSGGCWSLSVREGHPGWPLLGFYDVDYFLMDIIYAWLLLWGWYICYKQMHLHLFVCFWRLFLGHISAVKR